MTIDNAIMAVPASDAHLRQVALNVAASLPVTSLAHADRKISFVSGAGEWDQHIVEAVAHGAAGIVLDRPTPLTVDRFAEIRRFMEDRGSALVIRPIWSGHVTITEAQTYFRAVQQPVMIDLVIDGQASLSQPQTILGGLQIVEALVGDVQRLVVDHQNPNGFALRGIAGEAAVQLSILGRPSFGSPRAELRLLGTDRLATVSAMDDSNWSPIRAILADRDGEREAPKSFESPDRTAYKRLVAEMEAGQPYLAELDRLAALSALLVHAQSR